MCMKPESINIFNKQKSFDNTIGQVTQFCKFSIYLIKTKYKLQPQKKYPNATLIFG